jgi:hypothetical protein
MAAAHLTPHLSPLHGMMFSSVTVSILLPSDSPGKHDGVKLLGVATLIYYLELHGLPVTLQGLTDQCQTHRQTMSAWLDALVAKGIITQTCARMRRSPAEAPTSPSHARCSPLSPYMLPRSRSAAAMPVDLA